MRKQSATRQTRREAAEMRATTTGLFYLTFSILPPTARRKGFFSPWQWMDTTNSADL